MVPLTTYIAESLARGYTPGFPKLGRTAWHNNLGKQGAHMYKTHIGLPSRKWIRAGLILKQES